MHLMCHELRTKLIFLLLTEVLACLKVINAFNVDLLSIT